MKSNKKLFIICLLIFAGVFLINASPKAASEVTINLGGDSQQPMAATDYIGNLYTLGMYLIAIAALGVLVYGGVLYILSDSIIDKEEAKKWIWSALTGLLLALAAFLVLYTINPDLVKPTLNLPKAESKTSNASLSSSSYDIDEANSRALLQQAGINTKDACLVGTSINCVNVAGMKGTTINGISTLKASCDAQQGSCSFFMSGGTEYGHSEGQYSHSNGYKADIRFNDNTNKFLESGTPQGTVNGYQAYGFQYDTYNIKAVREPDHWDLTFIPL